MKKITTVFAIMLCCTIIACKKDSENGSNDITANGIAANSTSGNGNIAGRATAIGYSQSIAVDTANRMIQSYLTSVGFPATDTALRALSFDAGILRDYLSNPEIVTVKFTIAHQQGYINSGRFGQPSGMSPQAITLIIAGLNNGDQYVRNSFNGFYDHMSPCPAQCAGATSGLLE